ncbi:hypothetical protein B0H11DRAFT_54001 [Mycena galericulata]|nr:hypothetical protein B0H11DRAFT_54001 [Mycena galericulata]
MFVYVGIWTLVCFSWLLPLFLTYSLGTTRHKGRVDSEEKSQPNIFGQKTNIQEVLFEREERRPSLTFSTQVQKNVQSVPSKEATSAALEFKIYDALPSTETVTSAVASNHVACVSIANVAAEGLKVLSSDLEGQDDSREEREGETHCQRREKTCFELCSGGENIPPYESLPFGLDV